MTPAPPPSHDDCEALPFAATTAVPEASGAAWLDIDGALRLVVVADSGHKGAYGLVDPDNGTTVSQGALPLGDGASDDLEGVAALGSRLFAITSSGYVREWRWKAGAFELVAGPYPVGSGDLVCKATKNNCGKNYEGLALATTPIGGCAGYACSKADGAAYCLAEHDGKLEATGAKIDVVDHREQLADCAFPMGDSTTLYVGNNILGFARTFRVTNLADPTASAVSIADLGPLGTGFPEVVAVRGDTVYRMSDLGGDGPSMMFKFRCPVDGR